MKILSLGLDNSILDKNSRLARRVVEYGNLVDKYYVIVPSKNKKEVKLSDRVKVFGVKSLNKIYGLIKIYCQAKKILKNHKFDVITVQDQYYLALIGKCLASKFKIGLEIQVHGFEKYHGIRRLIAKFVIPRANAVRVVSQRLKKQLISEFGVEEEKITVIPIYTGCETHNVERETNKDKITFLTIGRLVSVKNIEMQIKAIAEIVKYNKDIELWIVGEGNESEKLEARSKKLGLEKYVKFFGWQDDLDKFYKQADVFLLTSNSEGWGIAVIEAAMHQLPIIMTDVGCAGEIIKDGESGIVIPVGDQEALEKAIVKLAPDSSLRKKLGQGARQAVEKLSSEEETLKLYKESLNIVKTMMNKKDYE